MERRAFGGRVIFEVTGPTLRALVVRHGFIAAVPECRTFQGDVFNLFVNVIEFMSRTKSVVTDIEETDLLIVELAHYWEFAKGNGDYHAVWEAFLDLSDIKIHDEWANALNADETLKAPDELQMNAPDDESLSVEKKSAEMIT